MPPKQKRQATVILHDTNTKQVIGEDILEQHSFINVNVNTQTNIDLKCNSGSNFKTSTLDFAHPQNSGCFVSSSSSSSSSSPPEKCNFPKRSTRKEKNY